MRRFALFTNTRIRLLVAGLLALALVLPATARVAGAQASEEPQFVASINEARASHGLRQLRRNNILERSSIAFTFWMLDREYFGHRSSIRTSRRFGLRGEVLARSGRDDPDPEGTVSQWLASPSHRAVLLNRRFQFIGIGFARGWIGIEPVTLVTGHFGGATRRVR